MEAKEVVKGLESSAIDVQVDKSLMESNEFANDLESNLMDLQVDKFAAVESKEFADDLESNTIDLKVGEFSSIEEDLIKEEIVEDEGDKEEEAFLCLDKKTVNSIIDQTLIWVEDYLNTKYVEVVFTILFGSFSIILLIVLMSDLKPEMIPFDIVPIELHKSDKLARQFSIFFTFISFITENVLFMRVVLCLSFGIGIIANFLTPPPVDLSFVLWNFLILLINLKHVSIIIYSKRHISFDQSREDIYTTIFQSLMSRNDYQRLMKNSLLRIIRKGRYYVNIEDSCDNLTILISGKMKKTDKKGKVSFVKEVSFIDSPEFIMQKQAFGQKFNISFYAETDCQILLWPREMINELLNKDKQLSGILLAALGIDVSYKIFIQDVVK